MKIVQIFSEIFLLAFSVKCYRLYILFSSFSFFSPIHRN